MKKWVFLCSLLFVNCSLLFAQFGLRVMPSVNIPVQVENFETPGFGGTASLDWGFPVIPRLSLGLSVLGGFADFPVGKPEHNIDSYTILKGGTGVFTQYRLNDRFSLRADANGGVYQYYWDNESNSEIFMGGSLSALFHITPFLSFFAETGIYLHSFPADLGPQPLRSFKGGMGLSLNLSELLRPQARLRGERTEQFRIFPVVFSWYEHNPLAMMQITNEEPNTITNVELSFLLERYMNEPSVFTVIDRLGPGESIEVPVMALFNESMLDLGETVITSAQVIARYNSLGTVKDRVFHMQMPVFHRNAMTWDDNRRAAAFVSPRDPAAMFFARYVSSSVTNVRDPAVPENVRLAAALFEGLRLYGINYSLFARATFAEKTEDAFYIDNMSYPYETLLFRSGACDSLSILYSSMLEALGIESAFITVPGHIYVAFDIDNENWRAGHNDIIELDGRRWLPVEVTVPDRGFTEAVRIGGRQWRSYGEEASLYPMHENWKVFPPVSIISAGDNMPAMPDRSAIAAALTVELRRLR